MLNSNKFYIVILNVVMLLLVSACIQAKTTGLKVGSQNLYIGEQLYHAVKVYNNGIKDFQGNIVLDSMECHLSSDSKASFLNSSNVFTGKSRLRDRAAQLILTGNVAQDVKLKPGDWFLLKLTPVKSVVNQCTGVLAYAGITPSSKVKQLKFSVTHEYNNLSSKNSPPNSIETDISVVENYINEKKLVMVVHKINVLDLKIPAGLVVAEYSLDNCHNYRKVNDKYLLDTLDFDVVKINSRVGAVKMRIYEELNAKVKSQCVLMTRYKLYDEFGKYLNKQEVETKFNSTDSYSRVSIMHNNLMSAYSYH